MKTLKFIIVVSIMLLISGGLHAEESTKDQFKKNAVYVDLLGNGLLLSINYSRVIVKKDRFFLSGQLGIGGELSVPMFAVPHQVTLNIGKPGKKSYFEVGVGGTFAHGTDWRNGRNDVHLFSYMLSPIAGYRFQGRRFFFRAYLSPLIQIAGYTYNRWAVTPYGGISLGVAF